ncbi:MAG: zinc ribbon domain-containing protein [Oscillospiraceae bacterium]|nr:zinc ribbon domain-containing protein [Oscillospiraceae bacterium]
MSKKPKKEKEPKAEKAPKMKVCPSCKEEIPKKAKVCPHCAAKQKQNILPLLLALVLVLVVGAGVSIVVFHFPIAPPFDLPFGTKSISDTMLGQTMELSKKEEKAVLAVFEECGFTEITDVRTLSSGEASSTYAVNDRDTSRYMEPGKTIVVELENEDKTVTSISCDGSDIYRDGEAVAPVTDFYMGLEQRDALLSVCLSAVKARLDLPETAVFPAKSKWTYTTDGDKVTVQSTVTVKNASGQEETRPFIVEFEKGDFVSMSFVETETE